MNTSVLTMVFWISRIALGRKDGLQFLDCDSDKYRVIKRYPDMPDFEIGIFFSGLTRSLVSSDYNLWVFECKTVALDMLATKISH